ncbi:hypothetical protein [Plastoroseomonas arctica]|uniref:Uncharacterized protein n=1 Tax=Plastoroseomonas arctica TaxID=1509237 RepID=A0AAF1KN08_9PROT|nr:hypothetical protein [Plastoroseomonas arctica]MBR0656099.1 hypothetical protein [Plastoroseomonas arctica]
MAFAIKADIDDPRAKTFSFAAHKTMYGGKRIATGETVFVFASESAGGEGLRARGVVTAAEAIAKTPGVDRQMPRVNLSIRCTGIAKRRLGRREVKVFDQWQDGKPETEINFKLFRQATNKVVGISEAAAAYLEDHF